MTITHEIHEPWRSHLAACIKDIEAARAEELRLRGLAAEAQERGLRRRASMEETIALIRREAELPDATYTLSANGATLTAELPDDNPAQ